MKRNLLFFIIILLVDTFFYIDLSLAQLNISTSRRIDAYWDTNNETWITLLEEKNSTLFKFNKEMTMFEHTTASISSAYYIESKDYDEENDLYTLKITSDVGNKYTMVIDLINKNLRFIYKKDEITYAVQHSIKQSWIED